VAAAALKTAWKTQAGRKRAFERVQKKRQGVSLMSLSTTDHTMPPSSSDSADGWLIQSCERGWLPDGVIRFGMRQLMRQRLRDEAVDNGELRAQRFNRLLDDLRASPIAIETQTANTQHYEVPASFFHAHLGPHLKYSCCLYPTGDETLAQAEAAMLERYAERAELADGQIQAA
jgi:cyclopropane-fatty-acyl-phospholipid synthase